MKFQRRQHLKITSDERSRGRVPHFQCGHLLYWSLLRLRRNTHRPLVGFNSTNISRAGLGHIGKERIACDVTGRTDLQLIWSSVVWQPFGPDWSMLAGNKATVCPWHQGGRGRMTEADTSRVGLPVLVSLQHRHKPGLMVADCQALT